MSGAKNHFHRHKIVAKQTRHNTTNSVARIAVTNLIHCNSLYPSTPLQLPTTTMAAVAVYPASFGSPGPDLSPHVDSASLFNSIHDTPCIQSDWDHFYGSTSHEEEEFYQLMEGLACDILSGSAEENEHPKWTIDSSGKDVKISFSESEDTLWTLAKKKIAPRLVRAYV